MLDNDLIRQVLTVTGPMGLLAYGMFWHHTKAMQENAKRMAELVLDRTRDRDTMISVVRENSSAIAALTERLSHVRIEDLRETRR